ncbi:arylesterase [Nitrincola alkalilacustris]|uniref:arylesterase n=1 Tax=Nitrincola alkalilacustris TaxID=1571224 RepID=UPI00124E5BFB|nr:arylesterase [Nitrincola alkalilacustris]
MRIVLSLLMVIFLAMPLHAGTILVLGDSLSAAYGIPQQQGWVSLLEKRLQDQGYAYSVVNASSSGETTSGGLNRLPALLERHQPDWVLVELGGNDGLRGLPLPVIRKNLSQLVELPLDAGAQVLLIGIRLPPNYGARYGDSFFELYADIADQYRVERVPFMLEGVALDWDLMQDDGIHPNAQAQPLILDTIWQHLEPLIR